MVFLDEIVFMKKIIQAKIYKGETAYVGECLDIPVFTQGVTVDEVIRNLEEAIGLFFEDAIDREAYGIDQRPGVLVNFEIQPQYV